MSGLLQSGRASKSLPLRGHFAVPFIEKDHILCYLREALPEHPNGMKFHALDAAGNNLRESRYLSVGGGFVVTAGAANTQVIAAHDQLPFSFRTGREMVDMCRAGGHTVARILLRSEEHTSELQSLMRISYAVFCLKKKKTK